MPDIPGVSRSQVTGPPAFASPDVLASAEACAGKVPEGGAPYFLTPETKEQRDSVQAEGCTEMQGYFISPAVPARDLAHLIARKRVNVA